MSEPFLEFEHASKSFDRLKVFEALSFRLAAGVAYGLVGPNACGKTTLLHSTMGLNRLDSGHVHYRGRNITGLKPHAVARLGLGIVLQNVGVFRRITAIENEMTGTAALRGWRQGDGNAHTVPSGGGLERARWALAQVELEGQDARIAGSMIPGEQKRLAFARVLYSARDFLLDEPVSGVGSSTRDLLKRAIRRLVNEGRSLLIVEHDIDFVLETCDEIMLLKNGQIACRGIPSEVVRNAGFREFYSSLRVGEGAHA